MKRIILPVMLILGQYCSAQEYFEYPTSNTTWTYLRCDIRDGFNVRFDENSPYIPPSSFKSCFSQSSSIIGDTIIGGHTYQFVAPNGYLSPSTREDSLRRVYGISPLEPEEVLLYNFAGNVGDIMSSNPNQIIKLKDSVLVYDGTYRDRFTLSNGSIVLEGIGLINDIYGLVVYVDSQIEFELLCMEQNGEIVYQHPDYSTCDTSFGDTIMGIEDLEAVPVFSISPNPFSQSTTVELSQVSNSWGWSLYNSLGVLVERKTNINTRKTIIQRGDLPAGIYVLQINVEGRMYSKKVLIE
ncbi:MAG: T9SS type A sorting domain-containing protein [Flavobacteriales bacterium]|nr:T9SS type A sorting domain-containing protein [Flavobacteriales bacterium]